MEDIKHKAIENFICSMDRNLTIDENIANAKMDAKLYKWNKETLNELKKKIGHIYLRKSLEKTNG